MRVPSAVPRYPADLIDAQWAGLEPEGRAATDGLVRAAGRPRVHDLRAMLDAGLERQRYEAEGVVTERLFRAFAAVHPLPVITAVLQQCRVNLDGVPCGAVPELLERLAHQRLSDLQLAP